MLLQEALNDNNGGQRRSDADGDTERSAPSRRGNCRTDPAPGACFICGLYRQHGGSVR